MHNTVVVEMGNEKKKKFHLREERHNRRRYE
jgi:hypothetical protein